MSDEKQSQFSSSSFSETNNQQISQEVLVLLLEKTIGQLNEIINQLNNQSVNNLPTQATVNSLLKSTEAIATSLETASSTSTVETPNNDTEITLEDSSNIEATSNEEWENIPDANVIDQETEIEQPWWNRFLSRIPFPNSAITGVLVTIIVVGLSTSVLLFNQPFSISQIRQIPINQSQPEIVETPSQLDSPTLPEPVEIAPPPQPQLTPEQNLIAAIQQEVIDLTNQYPTGLIGTIEADFSGSRLIITIDDQWYDLTQKRQDSLANMIFNKAQKLDFRKLELIDDNGNLIARSPVVGEEVIILQRKHSLS